MFHGCLDHLTFEVKSHHRHGECIGEDGTIDPEDEREAPPLRCTAPHCFKWFRGHEIPVTAGYSDLFSKFTWVILGPHLPPT